MGLVDLLNSAETTSAILLRTQHNRYLGANDEQCSVKNSNTKHELMLVSC